MDSMPFNKVFLFSRCILIGFLGLFLSGMAKVPPLVGGPAPQIELKTVTDQTIKLSDFKGRFVVLNFWATWCVPCIKEMPEFEKVHQLSGKNNIKIIGVNLGESKKTVAKFIADHRLNFSILLDDFGNTAEKYKVRSLPMTYFISSDGIIREEIFGGGLTKEMIETKINRIKKSGFRPSSLRDQQKMDKIKNEQKK